jgi:hypothetical protein
MKKCLIVVLMNLCLCVSAVAQNEADSLEVFNNVIKKIYAEMSFSGIDFDVTKITLKNYPVGIAFARYDKKSGKRQILINVQYLYQAYWKNKAKVSRDSTVYKLKGLIAHEWSHHFMGHTFDKNSRQKEHDADILAGRILFNQFIRPSSSPTAKEIIDAEQKAGLISDWYDLEALTTYHLARKARRDLLRKGFFTSLILHSDPLKRFRDTLIVATTLKRDSLKSLEYQITTTIKNVFDTVKLNFTTKLFRISQDTTLNLDTLCRRNIAKTPLKYSISANLSFSGDLIKVTQPFGQACNDKINSVFIESNEEFRKKITLNTGNLAATYNLVKNIPPLKFMKGSSFTSSELRSRFDTEAYYNLYYINHVLYHDDILETIYLKDTNFAFGTIPEDFSFVLEGGIRIQIKKSSGLVKYFEDNKYVVEVPLLASNSPHKEQGKNGFPYYFIIDSGKYYIDGYGHLWIETLGASPIKNKLFLQHFEVAN